jgi:hypothetical protein
MDGRQWWLTVFLMFSILGGGALIAVKATWLSLGLLTLIVGVIVTQYEHRPESELSGQGDFFIFTIQGIVFAAWLGACIIRPLYTLAHTGTIRIALDQFIR